MYILPSPNFDESRRLASSLIAPVRVMLESSFQVPIDYVWVDPPAEGDLPADGLTVSNIGIPTSPQDIPYPQDEQFEIITRSMLPPNPLERVTVGAVEPDAIPPHRNISFASDNFRSSLPDGSTAYLMMQAGGRTFYHIVPLPPTSEFYSQTSRVAQALQDVTGFADAKKGKSHRAAADILQAVAASSKADQLERVNEEKLNRTKVPQMRVFFQKRQQYSSINLLQELPLLAESLWRLYDTRPKECMKIAKQINVELSNLCQAWEPLSFAIADVTITPSEIENLDANIVALSDFKDKIAEQIRYNNVLLATPLAKTNMMALKFRRIQKNKTHVDRDKLNAVGDTLKNLLTKLIGADLQALKSVDSALLARVKEGDRMLFERRLAADAAPELDIVGKVLRSLGKAFLDPSNAAVDADEFEEFLDLARDEGRPFPCEKTDTGLVVKYRKVVTWYLRRQEARGEMTTASPFYGDLKGLLHFAVAPRSVEDWKELITKLEAKNASLAGTSKPSWSVVTCPTLIPASATIDQTIMRPRAQLMSARIPLTLRGDSDSILRVWTKLKRAGSIRRVSTASSTESTKSQKSRVSLFSFSKQKTEDDASAFKPNGAAFSRHGSVSSICSAASMPSRRGSVSSIGSASSLQTPSKGKVVKSSKFPFFKRSSASHQPIDALSGSVRSMPTRSSVSKFPFVKIRTESVDADSASVKSLPVTSKKRSKATTNATIQDLMRIDEETPSP
ncbi:MAG: uncharacterized protein KVP18_001435 [Porospora cf. gigantea A]|uniref:uncharacterized protein n=1 Tax=Porospora cf. gigantea A TaxID=2853593 RepID=UPI00355A5F75|nr:MAG: hypothetical protein KVP18_001435 [Porospora cf. gigantea A]